MSKARDLADFISTGSILSDGTIESTEISGVTATANEINVLDGITVTTEELNNVAGVNSDVQTQLDAKAPLASPTLTGTVTIGGATYPTSDGTEGQVLTTNGAGAVSFADPAGGGSADFVASGAISNGDVVSLNADGTVSVVSASASSVPQSVGSPVVFESADINSLSSVYDPVNQKVVLFYRDIGNSGYGTAVVGTVSGTSISFGSPVVFATASSFDMSPAYDANAQRVVVAYRDSSNSNYGTAVVGTVSGTSISFGTPVVFESAFSLIGSAVYDVNAQKIVIAYKDNGNSAYGTAIVGTVSGTSISFGTPVVFHSTGTDDISAIYDDNAQKVVIAYYNIDNSNYGTAVVGTVSGTSISFGSPVVFESAGSFSVSAVYDSTTQKVVVVYTDGGNGSYGTAVVGTVSGTSISFGTPVVFESANSSRFSAAYDANAKKVVIAYEDIGNSNVATAVVGTVSGTSITFDTPFAFDSDISQEYSVTYDVNTQKIVIGFQDWGNSNYGTCVVMQVAYTSTNASSYIGVAAEDIADTATGKVTIDGGVSEQIITPYSLSNASYDGVSFNVNSQEYAPEGLFFKPDGTKMYVVGYGSDAVTEYDLSTAWDITSATYLQNFSILSQESFVRGVSFKADGTKMYVTGGTSDLVFEYNLSTAWDVSSASYLQSFDVGLQINNPYDLFFKPDGTKMYIVGDPSEINEYNLSSAWDVTSASYVQNFVLSSQTSGPNAVYFNNTGTIMYILGDGTNSGGPTQSVFEYSLSTAWDVSSLSYTNTYFQVGSQAPGPRGMFIKPDGIKMYIVGSDNDLVHQYSIGSFGGYTTNTSYFVADDGTFTTTNNGRKIGRAISFTNLLVNSNMTGDEMNEYLGGLV